MDTPLSQTPQPGIPQVPNLPNSEPQPKPQKNTIIIAGTAIVLILILAIVIVINGQRNSNVLTLPAQKQNTQPISTPTPIVMDTAPAVPINQKAKIIVHHSDSSFETFLVPTSSIEIFKKSLQPGDTISQIVSPQP